MAIFSRLGLNIVVNISVHMVFCLPLHPSKAQIEGVILQKSVWVLSPTQKKNSFLPYAYFLVLSNGGFQEFLVTFLSDSPTLKGCHLGYRYARRLRFFFSLKGLGQTFQEKKTQI